MNVIKNRDRDGSIAANSNPASKLGVQPQWTEKDSIYMEFQDRETIPVYIEILACTAKTYYTRGLVVCIISAIFWLIVENICVDYQWMKYLQCHLIWHIGMSYGLSHLLFFFVLIECISNGHEIYFTNWLNCSCFYNCKCHDRRDIYYNIKNEIQNELIKQLCNNLKYGDNSCNGCPLHPNTNNNDILKRKYLLSQKKVKKICQKLSMYKFIFPQINVIDPIFATSHELDHMFEDWSANDVLTQVEVVINKKNIDYCGIFAASKFYFGHPTPACLLRKANGDGRKSTQVIAVAIKSKSVAKDSNILSKGTTDAQLLVQESHAL